MQMVSAAKLRKAQQRITRLRPYADEMAQILQNITNNISATNSVYSEERIPNRILLIIITSNRGLCGAFNHNIINKALQYTEETTYEEIIDKEQIDFLTIGKTGYSLLKYNNYKIVDEKNELFDDLSFENALPVAEEIMKNFVNKKYDRVELIYNRFKNAITQLVTVERFLPVEIQISNPSQVYSDYIYEPSKEEILRELIPESLKLRFFSALLDSFAAEHAARMTSMQQATDNANEILEELRLKYNKARQSAITSEILDIINGAEALKG
jgi:F-type H+-transporting ATPase subunit gamma